MFVSKGQFLIFIACLSFGFVNGLPFTVFAPVKRFLNNKYLRAIIDVFVFIVVCFAFVLFANAFNFPDYRAYMALGVIIGLLLYGESFHYILAKIGNIIYNVCSKFFAKRKTKAKTFKGIKTNERN